MSLGAKRIGPLGPDPKQLTMQAKLDQLDRPT